MSSWHKYLLEWTGRDNGELQSERPLWSRLLHLYHVVVTRPPAESGQLNEPGGEKGPVKRAPREDKGPARVRLMVHEGVDDGPSSDDAGDGAGSAGDGVSARGDDTVVRVSKQAWTEEELEVGRGWRGAAGHRGQNFVELARRLGRTAGSVASKWKTMHNPKYCAHLRAHARTCRHTCAHIQDTRTRARTHINLTQRGGQGVDGRKACQRYSIPYADMLINAMRKLPDHKGNVHDIRAKVP